MKRIRITELRKNLFSLADEVAERQQEIVLARRGREDLVLVRRDEWLRVKEQAARYRASSKKARRRSIVGSLVLKTKDLESAIRRIRDEFARSLEKVSLEKDRE